MHLWLVFLHVIAAFAFILAHGGTAAVTVVLRRQTEIERIRALLDLSKSTRLAAGLSVMAVLATGIAVGFTGDWWGTVWIWASLALLVLVAVAMTLLGGRYFDQVRRAVGLPELYATGRREAPDGAGTPEEIAAALDSWRPMTVSLVGVIGLGLFVWLMVLKPF